MIPSNGARSLARAILSVVSDKFGFDLFELGPQMMTIAALSCVASACRCLRSDCSRSAIQP